MMPLLDDIGKLRIRRFEHLGYTFKAQLNSKIRSEVLSTIL